MKGALYPAGYKVLVFSIIAGLIGIAYMMSHVGGEVANEGTQGAIQCFSTAIQGGSVTQAMSSLDDWRGEYNQEVSEEFEKEVMSLADLDALVDADGLTVGFTSDLSLDATRVFLEESLEQKGWIAIESGNELLMTFVKDTGSLCWLSATCVKVQDGTSVVIVAHDRGGSGDE